MIISVFQKLQWFLFNYMENISTTDVSVFVNISHVAIENVILVFATQKQKLPKMHSELI